MSKYQGLIRRKVWNPLWLARAYDLCKGYPLSTFRKADRKKHIPFLCIVAFPWNKSLRDQHSIICQLLLEAEGTKLLHLHMPPLLAVNKDIQRFFDVRRSFMLVVGNLWINNIYNTGCTFFILKKIIYKRSKRNSNICGYFSFCR